MPAVYAQAPGLLLTNPYDFDSFCGMRFGGIVLTALAILCACSSDPTPREPVPSTSAATPTATAPAMPARGKEDTPSGAATFVTYYIEAFNYGARTGDVDLMSRAAPRCKPCSEYAKDFSHLKPSELAQKDVWTVKDLSIAATRNPIELDADIHVLDEGLSQLTFVLNSEAPFEVRDIYSRTK